MTTEESYYAYFPSVEYSRTKPFAAPNTVECIETKQTLSILTE
jgi:hypothetical protein